MKIKKITALALVAAMTLSCITGCGKDKDEQKGSEASSGSVFDLMREEIDNATMSLDFDYKANGSDTKGNIVVSLDKDKFSLDTIKMEGGEDTLEVNKLISGGQDAIYLNVGSLTESLSKTKVEGGGLLSSLGAMIPMVFSGVDYLKIDLPKIEEVSTKEIEEEFIKNLETAITNSGFNFANSEDGKAFTLKITSMEGFNNLEKELYTQIKASSDVYATYIEANNKSLTNENVKTYIGDQLNGIFEEIFKYFEIELTESNKETLKTNVETLMENMSITSEEVTKEDAKNSLLEEMDVKIAEIDEMDLESIKSFEAVFVITETESGFTFSIDVVSEYEEDILIFDEEVLPSENVETVKNEISLKGTIEEGKASVSLPEKSTELKGIVENVMPLLDGFGILKGVKESLEGADEETVNAFIDGLFQGALFEESENEDMELIPYN